MSDTPRTDRLAGTFTKTDEVWEHSRRLERELASANICERENFNRAEYNLAVRDQYKADLDELGRALQYIVDDCHDIADAINCAAAALAKVNGRIPPGEERLVNTNQGKD